MMSNMKSEAVKNIIIAITFRIICLIVAIPSIRILISTLGSEANGINSLFISIVGILSLSELGIGSAITFCMYKPIINNDINEVNALYNLFTKIYRVIGIVYLFFGIILSNYIHLFIAESSEMNIQLLFILYLLPSSLSYLYHNKIVLLNAHKKNYISTIITQSCLLLKFILQIYTLYYFESFELFYISYLISEVICFIVVYIITNKMYPHIVKGKHNVSRKMRSDISKRIVAMFCHKVGGLFVNTTDNIIISTFVSVVVLGMYSNYILIMTSITSVLLLLLTPLTAIIGHLFVVSKEDAYKYYRYLYVINFIVSFIILSGYYAIADDIVVILFGVEQELASSISFVITITHFISMMRKPIIVMKDATGLYTKDKYKPLIECVVNLTLSLILVRFFGVVGVLISTIITSLLICHIIEPFVLYKYGFNLSVKKYLIQNYGFIITFIINVVIIYLLKVDYSNTFLSLLVNGCISVVVSSIILIIISFIDLDFKKNIIELFKNGRAVYDKRRQRKRI